MNKNYFPYIGLNKKLAFDSRADTDDVFGVKNFLNKHGFYDEPDYGITPYPDIRLFDGIKKYQSSRELTIDGVMNIDGETQNQMRIEKEKIAPPIIMIPGTNIPDEGMEDGQMPSQLQNDRWKYKTDQSLVIEPKYSNDIGIFIPESSVDSNKRRKHLEY